jgi:hypothetical protein
MLHTLHCLISAYLWTWTPKRQPTCCACGHRADCAVSERVPTLGRPSEDRTAYDEDAEQDDAENAALLKVDVKA